MKNTVKPVYAAANDRAGLLVTESIMLLSVLGGVGSLPFFASSSPALMPDVLRWYRVVTLSAAILTILAGVWYVIRQWMRSDPLASQTEGNTRMVWKDRFIHFLRSIGPALRSLFTQTSKLGLLVLPRFAVLTGILILLPALASLGLARQQNLYLFEIYFCTPALLVWIVGTGYSAFPILNVRPKHGAQIAGLIKSGAQALGGLLLWVYLGVSVGLPDADWLFWTALALAVVGGALGIFASADESRKEQDRGDLASIASKMAAAPERQG